MSEKTQIEEMANVLEKARIDAIATIGSMNHGFGMWYAEALYNDGYRKQSEWISVEERLPKRELQELMCMNPLKVFPCLVVIKSDRYNIAYVSQAYYAEEGFISGDSGIITERITHWMPLPEPPVMKGE